MATPLAPFYTQADQDIYAGGQHFIPQEQYRLGYTPPEVMGPNTGITNTQAAGSYMGYPSYAAWLAAQGGGGGSIFNYRTQERMEYATGHRIL